MFYAIDAYPAYQEIAYQVAAAASEHSAKGFAATRAPEGLPDAQIAGVRTHCVLHTQGAAGGVAVCDDATIISFGGKGARGHLAVDDGASGRLMPAGLQMQRSASPTAATGASFDDSAINASDDLSTPSRRWFADLLMTFGVGFLLVSAFLFVTARDPLPTRR
jgi:hypothetical protein